jgi:hypothetical protein
MDTKRPREDAAKGIAYESSPYRSAATVCTVAPSHRHCAQRCRVWWVLFACEPWRPRGRPNRNPEWLLTEARRRQKVRQGVLTHAIFG